MRKELAFLLQFSNFVKLFELEILNLKTPIISSKAHNVVIASSVSLYFKYA